MAVSPLPVPVVGSPSCCGDGRYYSGGARPSVYRTKMPINISEIKVSNFSS